MELLAQLAVALGDRYRVEREVGRGGMAVVFLAEDLKHRRPVAVKVLAPELSAVIGSERFLREIAIAATLQHPHIVPLYDSGEAGGLLYYVMPFVEGESLRERLDRERQLPLDAALQITRDIGSALQYAHDHGVVHRDVKPSNLMLTRSGRCKLMDFGLARIDGDTYHLPTEAVGTPHYMSPEQAAGGTVDGRSDEYSLACMLYEMFAGHPPFAGTSPQALLARHATDPVPGLRVVRDTVPAGVERVIVKAMAKLPVDRFATVQRFVDALDAPSTVALPGRLGGRRIAGRAAAIAGAGLLAAGSLWWVKSGPGRVAKAGAHTVAALAVLPFQDVTSDPDSSYLAEGMTEGLIADLAEIGSLKVISRASGVLAEGIGKPLAALARDLGVDAVVRGSVRRAGDSVQVSLRVLHASDSTVLFTKDYRAAMGALPELQRQMTAAIGGSVHAGSARPSRRSAMREVDQRAYESYLRGRFLMERGELEQARAQFEQAERLAPDWAPPSVGLATYYTSLPFFSDVPPAQVLPKARSALTNALDLDDGLAEAHAANAYIRAYYEWDWRSAEREFRRALDLRPSYADAYFSYGRFLASRRRFDEARAQVERAVQLDPLSVELQVNRALLDYFAGRYDEAESGLHRVLAHDSTDALARWGLGLVAEQQGRLDVAIAILEPISGASLNRKASLGHVYALAGKAAQASAILGTLRERAAEQYVPSYWLALVEVGLGMRDDALRDLERAYDERSTVLAYLLIDPRLAPLRTDPRFIALAKQLELE